MPHFINERRAHPRHQVRTDCLVFDSRGSVGNVQDISMGGLAFNSIYDSINLENDNTLGLLFGQNRYLDQLGFAIASSTPVQKHFQFSSIEVYRYGIKFKNLTPRQESSIMEIINSCQAP